MKAILTDIQTGKFVRDFMQENAVGQPFFKGTRRMNDAHQIEEVGEKLRGMMPWISAGKMVDKPRTDALRRKGPGVSAEGGHPFFDGTRAALTPPPAGRRTGP
jgi:hypothetical protein